MNTLALAHIVILEYLYDEIELKYNFLPII